MTCRHETGDDRERCAHVSISPGYIDFGVLGTDSGAVPLCSDSSHLVNLFITQDTKDMVDNMLAACIDQLSGIDDAPAGVAWSEVKGLFRGE
ncbi:hypothetical protein KKG45_04925 [bacterium]|nr:hypothetical protein [bacterium]MBU1072571.1 hypothetical protein [bacterium]MBU1675132.1 hypothetical protein [bacterium]